MQAYRDFASYWTKAGHFSKALTKGIKTTTWIWNLHADCHDFDIQQPVQAIPIKIFSAGIAHLAVVFFWLGGMHFHGAYAITRYPHPMASGLSLW